MRNESKARRRKALPRPKNNTARHTKIGIDLNSRLKETLENEDWEQCVDDAVEELIRRLPRMPFPPQHFSAKTSATKATTSATDLDFSLERILERTSTLRATLSSNNQSIKLLQAQIKREERALKRDKVELRGLEEGVRRGREVAARQRRDLHPLARDLITADDDDDGGRRLGAAKMGMSKEDNEEMMASLIPTAARSRRKKTHVALTNEVIEKDEDLAPLVKQLRSHLGSMQSNVAGLKKLRHTMDSAESMLMRFHR